MAHFKPLEIAKFPKKATAETSEQKYWKSFRNVLLKQDHSSVTQICTSKDFYAVTSSARVRFFTMGNSNDFSISKFRNTAIGGDFRNDGELFVAGDIEGSVYLFEVNRKTMLRKYLHPQSSYAQKFVGNNLIVTGCDDGVVRFWDTTAKKSISEWEAHSDYIRAVGSVEGLGVTGGYDSLVKLWDSRSGCTAQLFQGVPVTAVLCNSPYIIASGHVSYKVWDIRSSKELCTYTPHSKNITSLAMDETKTRLVTGSLDGSVKFHSTENFSVLHSIKYPSPVTALAITKDNTHLIAGMADGKFSVRQRKNTKATRRTNLDAVDQMYLQRWEEFRKTQPQSVVKNYSYFYRGANSKPEENEVQLSIELKKKLKDYDVLLKQFKYSEVLDHALKLDKPEVIISILHELAQRNGLLNALQNRSPQSISKVLNWVASKLHNPKYSSSLLPLANLITDMYSAVSFMHTEMNKAFLNLQKALQTEYTQQTQALEVIGLIDLIY